ncbi:MarR family winged helix-turn-helix transcriptional regulator [Paractinoplanes atraurantiacus]|uniref:DNA-binding transcriptional regulator, MarR family n=1 Tax=Paractinoplanes atraurantiacus TaxID=1036182 RepID=A0A285HP41_9ACTN|nr:MarR family transcriptional regulator [Actinoplanes atraurantiacus]SNY37353.1 DNA-binding transcriptional regulator, MarR family [Actinoplanes atraurantiacus]
MAETDELVDALAQLSFAVVAALTEVAGRYDMSVVQVRLLGVLRDREPSMSTLGRHLGLDKSSVSGLVDRAQRRGLITRTPSPTDRRSSYVSMTDTGQALATRIAAEFATSIEALTEGLSPDERRLLTTLATRIVSADVH